MNALLKKQIERHLGKTFLENKEFTSFFEVISNSYSTYEEQYKIMQRATEISSEELFQANERLLEESENQGKLIRKLQEVIATLKMFELTDSKDSDNLHLDGARIVEFISDQTSQLVELSSHQKALLKDLENRNKELKDYAHVVSHDLKSPLRNIDTLINFIKEDYGSSIPEGVQNNLTLIERNLEHMDNLINGILRYSAIDETVNTEAIVNVNQLMEEIVESLIIPDNVEVKIAPMPTFSCNYVKMRQVFQNLIDNAVRNIDKEHGVVRVECNSETDSFLFSVSDNGKGIDPEYHEKIFQIFQKIDNESNSTGIGLSIVKKIVDHCNGDIWLDSAIGEGSTFYVKVPKK